MIASSASCRSRTFGQPAGLLFPEDGGISQVFRECVSGERSQGNRSTQRSEDEDAAAVAAAGKYRETPRAGR